MKVKMPQRLIVESWRLTSGAMEAHSGAAVVCSQVYIHITSMIRIRIKKPGPDPLQSENRIRIHIEMPESSELS
jgi:hypothetical protein